MAADPIVYCLGRITDYSQFERLCHELMALQGYTGIEPLGGASDSGRDALHRSRSDGGMTVLAYSVRKDWKNKLGEDADKIRRHGHECVRLAFLTTADVTASERDVAVSWILDEFGWELDLFPCERIRTMLATARTNVVARFPQLFPPYFFVAFPTGVRDSSPDVLFVDYADGDEMLAVWLARKLTAEGYRTWCRALVPLAGNVAQEVEERVLAEYAFRSLVLLSNAALGSPDIAARRATAHAIGSTRGKPFVVPIMVEAVDLAALDSKTRALAPVRFDCGWAGGLRALLDSLAIDECPRPLENGRAIAALSLACETPLVPEPERVYSNCLPVERMPEAIGRFEARLPITDDAVAEMEPAWAFRRVGPGRFLSFSRPPVEFASKYRIVASGGVSWAHIAEVDGILVRDLLVELVRKSVLVACRKLGMTTQQSANDRTKAYFPVGLIPGERLTYIRPDGQKSWVAATGQRKLWRPTGSSEYRYHLAASFAVRRDLAESLVVLVRVRVHLTDVSGMPLDRRAALTRRKHLCGGWWNDDLHWRTLAIIQFLAGGAGDITVGENSGESIAVSASPLAWDLPVRIDEVQLGEQPNDREALLGWLLEDDDEQ